MCDWVGVRVYWPRNRKKGGWGAGRECEGKVRNGIVTD